MTITTNANNAALASTLEGAKKGTFTGFVGTKGQTSPGTGRDGHTGTRPDERNPGTLNTNG